MYLFEWQYINNKIEQLYAEGKITDPKMLVINTLRSSITISVQYADMSPTTTLLVVERELIAELRGMSIDANAKVDLGEIVTKREQRENPNHIPAYLVGQRRVLKQCSCCNNFRAIWYYSYKKDKLQGERKTPFNTVAICRHCKSAKNVAKKATEEKEALISPVRSNQTSLMKWGK